MHWDVAVARGRLAKDPVELNRPRSGGAMGIESTPSYPEPTSAATVLMGWADLEGGLQRHVQCEVRWWSATDLLRHLTRARAATPVAAGDAARSAGTDRSEFRSWWGARWAARQGPWQEGFDAHHLATPAMRAVAQRQAGQALVTVAIVQRRSRQLSDRPGCGPSVFDFTLSFP